MGKPPHTRGIEPRRNKRYKGEAPDARRARYKETDIHVGKASRRKEPLSGGWRTSMCQPGVRGARRGKGPRGLPGGENKMRTGPRRPEQGELRKDGRHGTQGTGKRGPR